jgi:hypothetical protein
MLELLQLLHAGGWQHCIAESCFADTAMGCDIYTAAVTGILTLYCR